MLPSYILHIWYYFIGHFRDPVINQPVFHGLDLFVCRQLLVEETILGTKIAVHELEYEMSTLPLVGSTPLPTYSWESEGCFSESTGIIMIRVVAVTDWEADPNLEIFP